MALNYDEILSNLLDNFVSKLVFLSAQEKFMNCEQLLKVINVTCTAISSVRLVSKEIEFTPGDATDFISQLKNDLINLKDIENGNSTAKES